MINRRNSQFWIYGFVMLYLLCAVIWWGILLYQKNTEIYNLQKKELISRYHDIDPNITLNSIEQKEDFKDFEADQKSELYQIWGEGSAIILVTFLALWLLFRSYKKEIDFNNRQTNFMMSVTHELKSPLSSISLIIQTLVKSKGNNNPDIKELGGTALFEAQRLNRLIDDILMASTMESTYQPVLSEFDLEKLFNDQMKSLRYRFQSRSLQIASNFERRLIVMDKSAFISILVNLVENAVKYSDELSTVDIEIAQAEKSVTLKVKDQGVGIPKGERTHIFEKFYRIGNESVRTTKGTGIGLYLVSQLVKAHKGKIDLESNQPQGSIFTVSLPIP